MENKDLLQKYFNKIKAESILKSCILAAAIAFFATFAVSFAVWFTDFKGWWIAFVVFAVVMAAAAPVLYFVKYRPNVKEVAKRLDNLGLEERVITMTELEGSDTIMAKHQHASTVTALGGVTSKMLKIAVSGLSVAILAISCVFGVGMTTVYALSIDGKVSSGSDVIVALKPDEPDEYYTLRYSIFYVNMEGLEIEGEGVEIDGNEEQVVLKGTDAEPVLVYLDDFDAEDYAWMFLGWFDDLTLNDPPTSEDPYRQDLAVTLDSGVITYEDDEVIITHYAVILQIPNQDNNGDGSGDGEDGDEDQDGDDAQDKPSEGDEKQDDNKESNGGAGDGAGIGKYDKGNNIINGDEDYRDHYEDFLREYHEYLEKGGEIPEELKKFIEAYYDIIK